MMKRKTWALLSCAMLILAIAGASLLVIFVDPFQVYRLATLYMPPIDNTTQVYANAGIARNYDYDSAIVGTSVTENFRPSQMDELLGGRFIKLCTQSGTAYNHALLMDLAEHNIQNRTVAFMENGTWAATSARQMGAMLEKCKNLTVLEQKVTIKSSLKEQQMAEIEALADALV